MNVSELQSAKKSMASSFIHHFSICASTQSVNNPYDFIFHPI